MSKIKGSEIKYEWEKEIPYKIFMNNYLGPDIPTVIENLKLPVNKLNSESRCSFRFNNIHTRPRRITMRIFRFFKIKFGIYLK